MEKANANLSAYVVVKQSEIDVPKVEIALIKREAKAKKEKAVWEAKLTSSLIYQGIIAKYHANRYKSDRAIQIVCRLEQCQVNASLLKDIIANEVEDFPTELSNFEADFAKYQLEFESVVIPPIEDFPFMP